MYYLVNLVLTTYNFMLLARILASWVPQWNSSRLMRFLGFYTDPYLNVFRRIIPPIGMLDISPMFAFMALQFIQYGIKFLFR